MKQAYKIKMPLLILFAIMSTHAINAQQTEMRTRQEADSIQKIKLMNALSINDEQVERIFFIRDSLLKKVTELRGDEIARNSITDEHTNSLRRLLNEQILEILGKKKYDEYIRLITNRLKKNQQADQQPLAGEQKH